MQAPVTHPKSTFYSQQSTLHSNQAVGSIVHAVNLLDPLYSKVIAIVNVL